jgi:cysteine desulfurase / selenocysteine lyase
MATQGATDWKNEWFQIEDATYLNTAAHTVMPRVSIRAVERSLEAKKFPHRVDDSLWFEAPVRIRSSLAKMIGAKREEIAVTTGASTGAAAVAHGLEWRPGDEIITAQGEFPLQYATWKPMEEREGVRLRIIAPRNGFITANDLIDALTPRTRIVSVSLVRYDDGTLLDAAQVSAACRVREFTSDPADGFGAIHIRHLNIHQGHIGAVQPKLCDCLLAVARFCHQFHVWFGLDRCGDALAQERMIIHGHDANRTRD